MGHAKCKLKILGGWWEEPVAMEVLVCSASQKLSPSTWLHGVGNFSCPTTSYHGSPKINDPVDFVKMGKRELSILHIEEMHFLREWVESMGGKISPTSHKTKSEENKKK